MGQYIFILHRLELVLLLKITSETPVGVVEESGKGRKRGRGRSEVLPSLWEKLYTENTSCTHVSKASCFCLCSSRCCSVEEGKLAAKTSI